MLSLQFMLPTKRGLFTHFCEQSRPNILPYFCWCCYCCRRRHRRQLFIIVVSFSLELEFHVDHFIWLYSCRQCIKNQWMCWLVGYKCTYVCVCVFCVRTLYNIYRNKFKELISQRKKKRTHMKIRLNLSIYIYYIYIIKSYVNSVI